ncbi:MAG: tetratricopeptide repeat protein [Acetatifactor sp.]
MFCRNCGTQIKEGGSFCTNCGAPVRVEEPVQEAVAPVEEPATETAEPAKEPAQEIVEPAEEPVKGTTEPVEEPDKETAEPVEESTQETAEPVEESVKGTTEPVEEPDKETAEPAEEPAQVAEQPVIEIAQPVQETVQPVGASVQPTAGNSESEATIPRKKKKKGKGKIIVLILVLLILVAGGVFAYLYFTGDEYNIGKNEKLAESCIASGEYEDAIDCYKEILDMDSSRRDIYIAAAEAYLELKNDDKAMEMLEDGLEACEDDEEAVAEMKGIMVKIYQKKIDACLADGNYDDAFSWIEKGYKATKEKKISARKSEVYIAEGADYVKAGDNRAAIEVLLKGFEETGDEKVKAELPKIYLSEAEEAIQAGDYEEAENTLWDGIYTAGDESGTMVAKIADIYRLRSDEALAAGDCLLGLQMLEDGESVTGSTELSERAEYVKEHVEALPEKTFEYNGLEGYIIAYEYDEDGLLMQKTKQTLTGKLVKDYDAIATYEYEKDRSGKVIKKYESFEGEDYSENVYVYEYVYDEMGNMIWEGTYYGEDSTLGKECYYEYDSSCILQKKIETIYFEDETSQVIEYEYDEMGNTIRYSYDSYGENYEYKGEIVYKYDNSGNLINEHSEWTDIRGSVNSSFVIDIYCVYEDGRCIRMVYDSTYLADESSEKVNDGYTFAISYDQAGRLAGVEMTDNETYDTELYTYSYDEAMHKIYLNDETCIGYYQPLDGEMRYECQRVHIFAEDCYTISYNMWTYDAFGNKICSVAGVPFLNGENPVLSYIYRYTGE